MKILALVHRVPYPPNKGEKIRAFHELRFLAGRGHTIDLGTFADVTEDLAWRPNLLDHCREVAIISKDRRFSRARSVLSLPRSLPLSVGYFESNRLQRVVDRWLASRSYDVAFCYSSPMAEFLRTPLARSKRMARVMDFVDVDSDKWRQYAEHSGQPMKALYRLEARSLEAYERTVSEEFDASTFVSPKEAEMFRKISPSARLVTDIPNGVDAEYFGATVRRPPDDTAPVFVFVGQMDYLANVDGVTWFTEEVLPLIRAELPGAGFRIVGRSPTDAVKALAGRPGVRVTGAVADIREHLAEATLMVAPLRIARGIQNKVLEGMAARLAVLGTPQAIEGIDAEDGTHALIRGTAPDFARAAIELTRDRTLRERVASAGRALVASRYAWEPAMERLEALMTSLVPRLD